MTLARLVSEPWPWYVAGPWLGLFVPALLLLGNTLTGARQGPLFARLGSGTFATVPMIVAALAGAWLHGWLRPRLPH